MARQAAGKAMETSLERKAARKEQRGAMLRVFGGTAP